MLLIHYLLQGLAGMLEVSIQADMPPLFLGNSHQVAVVTTMAVLPEMQRQGIGTALLEAAQCWAAARDVRSVALFVYRDNYTAIRYCTHTVIDSAPSQLCLHSNMAGRHYVVLRGLLDSMYKKPAPESVAVLQHMAWKLLVQCEGIS